MKKKIIITITALIILAGAVAGYIVWRNRQNTPLKVSDDFYNQRLEDIEQLKKLNLDKKEDQETAKKIIDNMEKDYAKIYPELEKRAQEQ